MLHSCICFAKYASETDKRVRFVDIPGSSFLRHKRDNNKCQYVRFEQYD